MALGLKASRITPSFRKNVKFAAVFSATVPIGIVFGVMIGYTPGATGRLISAIAQGLAAGTFLHVAFMELLPEEIGSPPHPDEHGLQSKRIFKILLIFIGYALMALLTLLTDH